MAKAIKDTSGFFSSDAAFNKLYPEPIRLLAHRHWTPIEIAKKAAGYLAESNGSRILDIGSGVGKFCMAGAHFKPGSHFYGIEQRKTLVDFANDAQAKLGLTNVTFSAGNFTRLNLKAYDHFYFYNSFYENLVGTQKIDDQVAYSKELHDLYHFSLYRQLEKMPMGTKLVTFQVLGDDWPEGYHVVNADTDNLLNYLIRI